MICPLPPENRIRAAGYLRASSTAPVMRSAASLSEISPRAGATLVSNAPPSTTMPSGAPRAGFHGGNRSSSGRMSALPSGEKPQIASSRMLATRHCSPARAKRVASSNAPTSPSTISTLEGSAKKPRIFERTKNIGGPSNRSLSSRPRACPGLDPGPRTGGEPGPITADPWQFRTIRGHGSALFAGTTKLVFRSGLPFALRLVAHPRRFVGRIEAGQICALLDLAHDPRFESFLLRTLLGDLLHERGRDHHSAVGIGDDDIAGKHRNPAAADRLLPSDEGEPDDRGGRGNARAPDRQAGAEHAGGVAHHAVGHQR